MTATIVSTGRHISFPQALCTPIDMPLRLVTHGNVHICNYDFERDATPPGPAPSPVPSPTPEPKKEETERHGVELAPELGEARTLQQRIEKLIGERILYDDSGRYEFGQLRSLLALSEFTTQGATLSAEESFKNIDEHMIGVGRNGAACSGLFITEDGWFLTAQHCMDKGSRYDYLVTHQGLEYRVAIGPYMYPHLDLAIGKADVPKIPKPVRMNLYDSEKIQQGQAVRMFGFRGGLLYRQVGRIIEPSVPMSKEVQGVPRTVFEFFRTSAEATPGYSGGLTIDHTTGGLVGVNTNYTNLSTAPNDAGVGPCIASKINGVLMLVNGAIKMELERYEKR